MVWLLIDIFGWVKNNTKKYFFIKRDFKYIQIFFDYFFNKFYKMLNIDVFC